MNHFKYIAGLKKERKICLKASREKAEFKIMPTYGARACCQIGLNRRQLGLVGEEMQIMDLKNIFLNNAFWKLRIGLIIVLQY